jgi:serpin B
MESAKVCTLCGNHCVPAQSYCPRCGSALPGTIPSVALSDLLHHGLRNKAGVAQIHDAPLSGRTPRPLAEDINDFAAALYGRLRERLDKLFFSPFSIATALAMTYAGARGETAVQMREALRCSASDERLHAGLASILRRLNAAGGRQYALAVANSLWGQQGAPLQPDFLDWIARHYDGAIYLVDFRRAAQAARAAINQWVEEKTKQRIRDLIPPDGVDALTRLVLVNAVYFKGLWEMPFAQSATRDEPFYFPDGRKVQVPLMHQREHMPYMQGPKYQAVELFYQGNDLSMLVLLPDRKGGLAKLEKALSARMLHDCVEQMGDREVKLYLPRFKINWGTKNLKDILIDLGMTLAFDLDQADFSGINGCQPPSKEALLVAGVFHKAFVEVNEKGTAAAAATGIMGIERGPPRTPPPVAIFRADHPFLFAIRDRWTGAVLFLGRTIDPTLQG